jgi:tyrosyl-tRNA synthetase
VTALVHGDDQVQRAERAAQVLFGDDIRAASVEDVLMVFEDAPSTELALPPDGMAIADMLVAVKLVPSKSEAMRLLKSGGVYVLFVLRKGRRDQHIVKLLR